MDSRSNNNSAGICLEEKFANVSSQLSNVTERLGHVEHDLDPEHASAWEKSGALAYVCVEAYRHNTYRRITQASS